MVMSVWVLRQQKSSTVHCFPCIVVKVKALWADEVNQKNADALETDDDDDDALHYVNSDLQSIIDELVGLHQSDYDNEFKSP